MKLVRRKTGSSTYKKHLHKSSPVLWLVNIRFPCFKLIRFCPSQFLIDTLTNGNISASEHQHYLLQNIHLWLDHCYLGKWHFLDSRWNKSDDKLNGERKAEGSFVVLRGCTMKGANSFNPLQALWHMGPRPKLLLNKLNFSPSLFLHLQT